MAKTKVDAMWEDLKGKGYFQSDKATFDKYFYAPGEQGYKNRKALYDDLHNKGYLQSPTYEDFAQRIGLHATGNAGNASAHGTTQSMLPADVAERRIMTAKQPTPLNKSKARQRLMQQQQAIQRQQKQWQQQSDRLKEYTGKVMENAPGKMENRLRPGVQVPRSIGTNPEIVRGNDEYNPETGKFEAKFMTPGGDYSSRAGAEAVLYRQAHPLEDELQQAYLERERLQQEMNRTGSSAYSANVGSGAAFMPQGAQAAAMYNSPEFAMLSSAYHKNEQRIKTLERERDADGFWSTLGKELFSLDTWDFGAQEFMDASTMMRYFDRDDLTDQERGARQSMLENAFAKNAADQQYGQNDTFMQRAASITAQALPFVAQFLATGGMSTITEGGAELGAKAAARWATGRIGEWMLKNTGVLLGDLAAGFAMANTVGMLQTGADIMGRRQGKLMMGPDGSFYFADGKSWGRSIWEGEAANTLEYYTEMLGAHLDGLLGGVIGRAAMRPEGKLLGGWLEEFGDKVGLGALSDVFSRITGSELQAATTNILRRGGVNEIPSEIFEEEANLLLNAMLVGDNKISDLWDPKTQADIWGGMCLSVGFMQSPGVIGGAHQTAQYYRYKHATDVADQKARARLGDEQWDALKALLDGASNQEIPVVIANMRADSDMSTLGKTAVMDYAKNLLKMRGYNLRTAAEAKSQLQQPDEAQPAVKDESGTSFAEGYNAGEQDMEPIKNRLEAAQRTLTQMGYDVGSLDGKQLQDFSQESLAGMPDDERAALLEFFNARAAFEGMRQKVNDDVDTQVQHASDLVDMQTNRDTHMMHRATLNNGQEVYVTVGRLVMTGDGTMVDTEASDESLFGYNTATGEVGQYTPQDFKSVDDPVNPEQAKAESAESIRREVAGRAAAAINGDLAFNDGDEFDILGGDNATHHIQVLGQQDEGHVFASIDGGEAQVIPKNELQAMHDNLKDAVKDMEDAAADAENVEEPLQNNGPRDNAAPVEEPFEMPLDEEGEPIWGESTPEQGYQYLTGGGLADEDIDAIIAKQLSDAVAAQKKARDDGKVAPITRANAAVDYWNNVAKLRDAEKAANAPAAPVAENEMKPVEAAPAVETPADQEPTEQAPESKPEQRKSLSEETGVLAGDRETLAQSMSPRTLEMIHKIAQQLGLKIRVYNDPNAAGENGYFDGNTNTIWVNTARRTGKLASWVLGHEMTHAMDARATDKKSKVYKDFKRIAVSFVRSVEGIEAYEARIKRTMERYKNAPGVDASKVTRDYIEDEVACDMAGELLAEGPEFMERLFRDATDRNALERVLDAVRDFVDRMLSILNATSDEYRALTILRDSMNKMYNDVKIQGEISNELEPEADAEVETDITPADEDRQERKDRQRAKRVKRKRAKRKSVTAIVEGAGMQASENVKETWKVPQADGTFKEEERWVKRPLLDDQGNVVFRMGDKEFNGNNPVSVEDLEENPDTVLNYMLNDAVNIGKLSEKKARQIRQKYADMLNAYLRRGMPTDEATGFENLEDSWMWVGEAAYKTVASNSDEQYSYSLDITRVCKKNEAVIRAISALQVKTGYGVTPGQIMDIYLTTDAEGYQVPCPVCYVFSRYINNGKYATAIVNGMQKYGKYLPGQAEEKDLAWWVDRYNEENAKAKKMKSAIDNANGDVKTILQNIDTLSREITGGTLSDEEREAKLRELHDMDERYRAALDVISQEAMPRWIKAFVLAGSAKDGWRMREDAAMPEDMDDFISHALDIRKTASAMVKYPAITRYRRAGGSAGGKEITFASNNDMGSIAMALGISKSNLDNFNNYYQLALEAGTEEERKALLEKARKRFGDARLYAQRQTLRGGQRMWSWSDNIEALASDVASNLMQLEMLGGALQTYSKQLEGVKMVAAMNGYVNASLMGYGDGMMEVNEDNITTDEEGRRVLAQDITEVNNKGRERIIANAGSPIYRNEDGKDYVLVFDDVVGIDPFGHEGNDGKFRRGLFALNEEYDRAGNILVGMNDIHVRAAMADPRVFFIIPWHASGMSNHILMQMFRVLGVDTENFKATDYTKMQEETNFLERTEKGKIKHKVTQAVRDFWNSHTYEGEFRSGIGHIPNGDRKEGLSKQQLHYRELRDAIFDGTIDNEDKKDWKRQVERDEFLSQVYRQVTTRVDDGKMTEKDKEFIYPYEYWDESSTYETADINGKRYLEYCRRMGFKPKFTGRYDEKAGYSPEGNFADDPGYWKLLIDRRMYDREGKFQDLTPVDSEGLESSMYDPMETQKEFNVTEVATNEGAERIADIVYQQEVERSGSMPTPNLSTTLEDAVEQYKDTVKRQAARVKAENDAKKAEEAARIKAEKAAERARKKAEREAEMAKQRKSLGDIIDEALQSAAIPQPEEANDSNIRYSLRTKPAPKKTLPVYKLMRLGDDGKLYPLFIDAADAIELGVWYDADSPNLGDLKSLSSDVYTGTRTREENGEKITEEYRYGAYLINNETGEAMSLEEFKQAHKGEKAYRRMGNNPNKEAINYATANNMRWVKIEQKNTGQRRYGGEARSYYNYGINGAKNGGAVGLFAMRPGWHAGSLPTMRQIGKGSGRNLRDDRFVWVEGVVSADVDYNAEAQGNPDKDIPDRIPEDGYYLKSTNANADAAQADRVGWYVAGAFKPERIIGDREAREIIDQWNDEHPDDEPVEYDFPRESGKVFNAETMQLEDDDNGPDGPKGGKRFSIDDAAYAEAVEAGDRKKVARMVKDAVKAAMPNTKAVDRWGKPRLLYHGTPQENQFYEFNGTIYLSSNRSVANEYTHYRRTFGANPRQTGRIMPVFVNLENPLEIDANRHLWRNIDVDWSDTPVTTRDIEQYAKDNGYDGVIIKRVRDNMYDNDTTAADVYIAFSPEQVKSAGPTYEQKKRSHFPWDDYMELDGEVGATYDNDGNLIPLSERFNASNSDIRFSFAGPIGAEALDTLDGGRRMADRNVAEEMERAGKDAKTIKLATGWERGADNKWRYEIMDKGIKDEFPNNPDEWIDSTTCLLSSIIDNEELFNAYPELKTASVEIRFDMNPRTAGSAGGNHINLNADHIAVKVLGTTLKRYWPKAKELKISWNHFKKYHDEIVKNGDIPQFNFIISATTKRVLVHEVQHLIQRLDGFARGSYSGDPNYRKTAGEVEARNVENRYFMSENKRRNSPAEETEDVPRSEQIVRYEGDNSERRFSLDAAVAEAEQMTETNPTDGQKESGNYRKGHVKVDGFDISIEQPKGSVRSGVDSDGNEWSQEMHNTYGYIRGTEGVDGDHIDVFLSDHLDGWNGNVYVVDQVNKDRSFDEHKVMYGFNSEQEAREAYLSNYEEGWTGLGNITGVTREEFKKWVDSSHRKNKPFAEYKNVKPLQSTGTGDRARFSISERTDEDGNEVYTETREDGTIDREITTFKDGSKSARWFDNEGTLRENLFYFPNGEVSEVANFDSDGELSRHIVYDENRRAIRHWEPRIGTDWERDENGVARGMSNGVEMVRYSLAPTFFSNAAKAVEDVKQEKAKAEQWKAMLTKTGGIKAGEDKWMGLSAWLDEHKGETLTKEQVRQFVAENGIQMEETHYSEYLGDAGQEQLDKYRAEYADAVAHVDDIYKAKAERFSKYCNSMEERYGEDWLDKMTLQERMTYNVLAREQEQADPQINDRNDIAFQELVDRYGDDFGIAFEPNVDLDGNPTLMPTLDYYDNINDAAKSFLGVGENTDELMNQTRSRYTTEGLENKREIAFVVPGIEPYQENDEIHFGPENQGRAVMWVRFGETRDADGNRVLVIDEIQSNRHQNARDVGYIDKAPFEAKREKVAKARTAFEEANAEVEKYVEENTEALFSNNDENVRQELNRLKQIREEAYQTFRNAQTEPVDYNNANGVPAAPFEKNWHEVAMKRMLRLAAEEGFDKVAWTTGEQQDERYNIGNAVRDINAGITVDGERVLLINLGNARTLDITHDDEGNILRMNQAAQGFFNGAKNIRDIVGKEITDGALSVSERGSDNMKTWSGDGLRLGGSKGMSGFYDNILPRFMDKYGKRWGVKTGEVTLDTPGKETMHSVDVNEDMKRSVMQGQPLFSLGVEQERTLMGMHNITAEKLRSALKLGGLANPSMAVINTEVGGFTNFGEISLIPSADLIASRTGGNAGTWGADAYSPRFPETHRRLGKGGDKKMRAWVKGLKMRQEMEYNTEEQFNDYYNGFNIRDNALVYPFLHEKGLSGEVDYYTHMNVDQRLEDDLREVNGDQWELLKRFDEDEEYKKKLTDIVVGDELRKINKKEGETFQEFRDRRREWAKQIRDGLTGEDGYINRNLAEDLLYAQARAYRENGKFSESRTRDNAEQYIRDHGLEEEYKQYFEQKMQELGAELQVYAGSDSQGRSKYKPVSLEQVSRMMKKQGRAGGEGGIFADSPGAIRAKLLTPMKTLDQIRAKKDRLVSHEAFEQFRERYQEELRENADVYARGSMGALADILTSSNMAATAKRYNIDLDADAVAELNKFKNRVRALPTEYFETKFERPVMLDEFKKAIIPDDLPLDLQGALQRAGLEVVEYKHGDNADRERVTLDAVKNDDSIRFSIQGLDGYTEQDVLDGVRGDIEAKLEEAGVDDVTIKGMALHGSRMRGDAREDSDLDVVMEYDGDWSEDALFDLLNDEPVYFDGVKVDINPITRGKSGTLEQYMERSRRYDEEKIRANSAQYNDTTDATRFSLSGDGTVDEYNRAVNMTGRTFNVGGREVKPGITRYNFQEAFQDAILSVKKLQQVVERHFGIKLPTRENAWMYENRLSSINMHERKSFIDKVYEPMMKIADAIMKRGVKEKELNAYLICKHGLERNQVFAQRDANEEANEIARNGGTPDMQQLLDKYRERDYSGLTGVTGIQGDIAVIEAETQRIVDEFEQKHGQLCNELWDAIRKATQWSLRKSYQSGMMSAATFNHVQNMFQYYVPLRGWSETTAEDVYSYMMGEHGAFNGVLKKAEGRTSVADDPLATIGNMAESALMQGNKNLLKQHLLRMAQNHPTDVCQVRDVWLVEGPGGVWEPHWPNIPDDATPDEIDQILQDHENDMLQLEAGGSAKRVRNNLDIPYRIDPRHVPEHAVVAKVAGVDHVVYINGNPRAAQAINGQTGAGRGSKSGFSRLIDFIFGDMKRFYSSVLTSLNINFSGANFVRDLPHAYAMTFIKRGPLKTAEYIARSFQVIPWVFKNQLGKTGTSKIDRYFQEFLSSGSVTGYAHINDVDAWKADNKRRFARLSALGKARVAVPRALGEVINAIGWFSETLELIPRFTAFLVERESGKDIATATKAAKDITTNFNKKGSEVTPGVWGAVANTLRYMKMFFNPIVQGMYQFVDVASKGKENKWVGPRMVLATMHLPVLGAIVPYLNQFLLEVLGGDDDDDYWLINEYTRRNNVCIFTGNGYVKIPIAPVFRELYGLGEVVATRHAGKADNEKTTVDLIDQLRTMGSVEGQSSYNEWSLARFLLPEHFAPLIDVMNNENFTGGPIYYDNNYKEYAPEYTKAKKNTWSPLVAASKWLNEMMGGDEDIAAGNSGKWMNPAVWQHLITNVGGGFAQLAGDVVSGITDITEGKEIDASNMPVLKRFYSNSSDERANWARFGIYKDYEKDYTMAKEKYQALDKRGLSLTERADEMVKFAESHPRAAAIYAVWEGGIKGADIPARLEKLGKDDPAYWDLVKEAVDKAEKAMNSGYVRAWEQKRKDRPDSMSDKELNDRFDKSDNDSIRHIMADEISKRAGSQDWYGRDPQDNWKDNTVAAWEAYQNLRISDDIQEDAELFNLLSGDERKKEKKKDKETLKAIRKQLGQGGDDDGIMERYRAARKRLIEKWQGQ